MRTDYVVRYLNEVAKSFWEPTGDLRGDRGEPRVIVIFHPLQLPLAQAIQADCAGCEIWYSRWDRYELAYDATPERRERLAELHEQASEASSLTFAVSDTLVAIETDAGRDAMLVTTPADRFPAPQIDGTVVAISLGHALLNEAFEDLVFLGEVEGNDTDTKMRVPCHKQPLRFRGDPRGFAWPFLASPQNLTTPLLT